MNSRSSRSEPSSITSFTATPPPIELQASTHAQAQPRLLNSLWQQTVQSRGVVLGTLFLVTGALGLPLLWYSPVFSQIEKWVWSIVVFCYTAALIGITWAIVVWCYRMITGAF
jgi:hypothetical protein